MRHVLGFVIGIVLTAVILLGSGWASQDAVKGAVNVVAPVGDVRILTGLAVMAVVGLVLGLVLVGRRLSPLAAFVPAIVMLAWTVVYALDVTRAMNLAPTGASVQQDLAQAGRGMQTLLSAGVYGMLGLAMFIPVLMPSRWAPPPRDDADEYEETPDQAYY